MARLADRIPHLLLIIFFFIAADAFGFSIVAQNPSLRTYEVYTTEPVKVTFNENIDTGTLNSDTFFITLKDDPATKFSGALSAAGRIVTFAPDDPFDFGKRYQIHISQDLKGTGGSSFDDNFPFGSQFVANIPNDLARFDPDPMDPIPAFQNSNVLLGFDPVDPESTDPNHPELIPGMSATEAWKYTIGRPEVIIAVVDNGMERYWYEETMDNFFLNQEELPLPNVAGEICAKYDCNNDGRFNVRDYDNDDRLTLPEGHPISPAELIDVFSDGVDDDQNGLTDDICGWDFLRNVNEALGVREFDEGAHGEDRARDAAGIADNGVGDKPGFCPNCTILPIRTSDAIMGEYNAFGRGVQYAMEMGAKVICAASGTPNYTKAVDEIIAEAYEKDVIVVAAIGDELGFHHSYPAAAEDVLSVKSIFPIPPIDFYGIFPMEKLAFVETYCTNYGAHLHLSGSSGACSSEATGNVAGAAGLLHSRAIDLGLELSANEIKQILAMTSDDIYERCLTLTGGGCKEGWDEHFGYGRPNLNRAILTLGDPETGLYEQIPPEVRITSPRWYSLIDPADHPLIPIEIDVYARSRTFHWTVEYAVGAEPDDSEFIQLSNGSSTERLNQQVTTLDTRSVFEAAWLNKIVEDPDDFTVWIRCRAFYVGVDGPVYGEHRKTIAIHADRDDNYGLLPGFPIDIGASGESSPLLVDLNGADNGNLELVFGTSDGYIEAKTYDEETGQFIDLPGWPVSIRVDPTLGPDVIIGTVAAGDLFHTGSQQIVATTGIGCVFAVHASGNLNVNAQGKPSPFLDGFPVCADLPDNESSFIYGHGRSFGSSPVLADLDLDDMLEIIASNYDGKIYVWKSLDLDGDGFADYQPGFPVLAQSTKEQVGPEKWCPGEDQEEQRPAQILATPAVGPLDPLDEDPDLSLYPAIIVPTTEVCHDRRVNTGRVYAIHHDGYQNFSGSPFIEGFPIIMSAPLSGALPIPPLTTGITSSPAMAYDKGRTHIGISPFGSFPSVIRYSDGEINLQNLNSEISINGAGHVSFGKMNGDEDLYYVMTTLSGIKIVDDWISLLRPLLMSWRLDDPGTPVLKLDMEDIHFFINPVLSDINGDGMQEALAGSSGFVFHAVDNLGRQPETFPKFTNNWIIASPVVGDADGDGLKEIFLPTHEGNLFGWQTASSECQGERLGSEWRKFHHDEHNSGVYGKDTLPPKMITDLTAEKDGQHWVLTWTAPGDDLACGRAVYYDIRFSAVREDLENHYNFSSAQVVDPREVPSPEIAGTVQTLRIRPDLPDETVYFAIQTTDDSNLLSQISVIAPEAPEEDDDGGDDDDDDEEGCGCD